MDSLAGYRPTATILTRTKPEVTEMKIGQKIKDNDPRVGNRVLKIIDVDGDYVIAQQGGLHSVRIRRDRIYTDGKPRRSGFTIIGI